MSSRFPVEPTSVGIANCLSSSESSMKILVTGAAGFIGMHTSLRLLSLGHEVVGVDNFNEYYSVALKEARHARLERFPGYRGYRADLADDAAIEKIFAEHAFDAVCNLAAQAGVRYSLQNPRAYVQSNLAGFVNILDNGILDNFFGSTAGSFLCLLLRRHTGIQRDFIGDIRYLLAISGAFGFHLGHLCGQIIGFFN